MLLNLTKTHTLIIYWNEEKKLDRDVSRIIEECKEQTSSRSFYFSLTISCATSALVTEVSKHLYNTSEQQ